MFVVSKINNNSIMKNSVKELTEGMQRLCAIANKIVAHGDAVSPIERDLLLEDLRRLYDVALSLDVTGRASEEEKEVKEPPMPDDEILSSTVMATIAAMSTAPAEESVSAFASEPQPDPAPDPAPAPEPDPVAEPLPEPEPAPVLEPEPVEMPMMEELENNGNSLLFDEVIIEETPAQEPEPEPVAAPEPEKVPEPDHKHAGTQASLLDYLKRPVDEKPTVRTLGEKLGGVENGELKMESEVGNAKKVTDLRTVININDKFSFMSELFHNNMKAYNDFILRLNAIDTRDEALLCVNEVSTQYKWDESSLAVQAFYKVFDKKF